MRKGGRRIWDAVVPVTPLGVLAWALWMYARSGFGALAGISSGSIVVHMDFDVFWHSARALWEAARRAYKTLLKDFGVSTLAQDTTLPAVVSFLVGRHIVCTPGGDLLLGESGPNLIEGLGGDEAISGAYGDDLIYGGPGDDSSVAVSATATAPSTTVSARMPSTATTVTTTCMRRVTVSRTWCRAAPAPTFASWDPKTCRIPPAAKCSTFSKR